MRLNGLYIVVELAARKLADPVVTRYKKPLILGSLREDVGYIPGARFILEHLSFSHFYQPGLPGGLLPVVWPGPRLDWFAEGAFAALCATPWVIGPEVSRVGLRIGELQRFLAY